MSRWQRKNQQSGRTLTLSSKRKKNRGQNLAAWRKKQSKQKVATESLTVSTGQSASVSACHTGMSNIQIENRPVLQKESCFISGIRIVDINHFFQEIQNLNSHGSSGCSLSDMTITDEKRYGLISGFKVKCKMCSFSKVIWTEKLETTTMNSNTAAVAAAMSIEGGFSVTEEAYRPSMSIPAVSRNTFSKEQEKLSGAWELTALAEMELTGKEERKLAIERGEIDSHGVPVVTVVVDGSWAKQSYKSNYASLSGVKKFIFNNLSIMEHLRVKAANRSFPGFEKEKESCWSEPFYFIQGADTQFGMIDTYILKLEKVSWDKEIKLTRDCIQAINAMQPKPKFFIVCGDLVHAMPGGEHRNEQVEDFIKVFKELNPSIPLICVCGNHDLGNTPTHESVKGYVDKFGDDYFTFYCAGVMFIVLNSQFFEDSSLVEDLAKEQENWLDQQLEEAKSGKYKHVIIFQHIPWFLRDIEEEKEYFNFLPDLRKRMLQKFYDANVRAIFCGHYHRNAGGFYKDLELVVTSAVGGQLGVDKSGFRVVTVGEDSIKHKYYTFEEAPKSITFD